MKAQEASRGVPEVVEGMDIETLTEYFKIVGLMALCVNPQNDYCMDFLGFKAITHSL